MTVLMKPGPEGACCAGGGAEGLAVGGGDLEDEKPRVLEDWVGFLPKNPPPPLPPRGDDERRLPMVSDKYLKYELKRIKKHHSPTWLFVYQA
jgi:hypothetical protein